MYTLLYVPNKVDTFRFDHMFSSMVATFVFGASSPTIVRIKLIATTFINATVETEGFIMVSHFRADEKMVRWEDVLR